MTRTETKPQTASQSGINLNKKTLALICVLLAAILIFAGVLTQILPRSEYCTYPENTYRLANGETVIVEEKDAVYESGDGSEMTFDEYCGVLRSYGVEFSVTQSITDEEIAAATDLSGAIIDGTWHEIDFKLPIWKIPASVLLVFGSEYIAAGAAIILMIVLIGGTFLILDERNILKYIMAVIIKRFSSKKYLLLAITVFICMLLSSTAGILEESVTLVPITVAIALALGWDSFVGLSMSLVAVAFGFTAATFNPFNVVVVQNLIGTPVFSGLAYRILVFILIYAVLMVLLIAYAKKIEKHPEKSLCYESDKALREKYKLTNADELLADSKTKKATKAFIVCLSCVIVCIMLDFILGAEGMISMPGMAILFTIGGITAGYCSGLRGKELAGGFFRGIKTILPVIPLIVFILSITFILGEGMIIHTILNYVYNAIQGVSLYKAILILFAFIVVLEFFIGSGTAKAFLIMPIVAPLAQLIGLSGNSVVLTFCLGDGFTNLLYPTSGIMIIAIGLVNISYGKWLRFSWKIFAAEGLLSVALMHLAIFMNYQ